MKSRQAHLLQFDIAWEDKQANYRTVREMCQQSDITPGDLIVLPEMFDTGFSFNLDKTADQDNQTAEFLAQLAMDHQCTVHGSCTTLDDNDKGRNLALIFDPEGNCLAVYEKLHPFSYDREAEFFDGGDEIVTYTWADVSEQEGMTVAPAICYDLRFPELFRLGLVLGAECFVIGANWPEARHEHWRSLCIARAIENQAYVIACNRAGSDPHLQYKGGSLVIDPKGDVIAQADDKPQVLSASIDIGRVDAWRQEFPAWRDRRIPMPGEQDEPESQED
jgi:omega-amidase